MHEGGRDEHACSEVPADEERIVGHVELRESAHDERKGAGEGGEEEDEEEGKDVDADVVAAGFIG